MSSRIRRSTAILSLVAYLLAMTASELLHDHHSGAAHSASAHGIAGEHQSPCGTCSDAAQASDDDCSICRYLGQVPVATPAVSLAGCCGLVAEVRCAASLQFAPRPSRTVHSRAPPQLVELV